MTALCLLGGVDPTLQWRERSDSFAPVGYFEERRARRFSNDEVDDSAGDKELRECVTARELETE